MVLAWIVGIIVFVGIPLAIWRNAAFALKKTAASAPSVDSHGAHGAHGPAGFAADNTSLDVEAGFSDSPGEGDDGDD